MEVQTLNGMDAEKILKAQELAWESKTTFAEHMRDDGIDATQQNWDYTWSEFLLYAQQGDRGDAAKENITINDVETERKVRETHPTLYPGE
eukprot:5708520-Pleurochrysis_carterae.AAC.1